MTPNIIYLHSHDTGRHISPYGYAVSTPNMAKFAAQGTLFRNAFCAAPTCSPSRAALLMGSYPHQNGMMGLAHRGWRCHDYSSHVAAYLGRNGYVSAQCGVEHLKAEVYDQHIEAPSQRVKDVAPAVANWLENAPSQPFFLDVGFAETHTMPGTPEGLFACGVGDPSDVKAPAPLPDVEGARQDYADYKLSVTELDRGIGLVLEALERAGLSENTIIVHTTDHGIPLPGMKCNLNDSGIGVLLMMRGPGIAAGNVVDSMVSQLDIYPTLCEAAGIATPDWCEGASTWLLLRGETATLHEAIFAEVTHHAAYEPMRAIRTERYKYIRRFEPRDAPVLPNVDDGQTKTFWHQNGWPQRLYATTQLYDLWCDPAEADNLSGDAQYANVEVDLSARLEVWMRETNDPILDGAMPVPAGGTTTDVDAYSP